MSLEDLLSGWTGPSSATEQDKQDRTERMVREAVRDHGPFADCSLEVYAKGSYANTSMSRRSRSPTRDTVRPAFRS